MKLLLPTRPDELADLPGLPDDVSVAYYDPAHPVPQEHEDAEALVAWDNAPGTLEDAARRLTRLRWVQGLAAGPDAMLAAGFADDVVLCNGVGLHDRPVAEHALALTLALVRRLPTALRSQAEHTWDSRIGGMQPLHPDGPVTTLLGARVLVWGFGSIGTTLAPMLTALGAEVRGAARTAGTREGYEVVDEAGLDDALARTDVLVMILPGGDATRGALSAERMARLPRHAYVVNVGRGTTLDESALVDALRGERLGGAALDVTETEPLDPDSPVWDAPGLILTPHAAGGRPVGAPDLVVANAKALLAGEPLCNAVER